jgi:hypothetical protein
MAKYTLVFVKTFSFYSIDNGTIFATFGLLFSKPSPVSRSDEEAAFEVCAWLGVVIGQSWSVTRMVRSVFKYTWVRS